MHLVLPFHTLNLVGNIEDKLGIEADSNYMYQL